MAARTRFPILILAIGGLALAALACAFSAAPTRRGDIDTLLVNAAEGWQDSGFEVQAGDRLIIRYLSGQWSPWPGQAYDAVGSGGDPACRCNVMEAVSHAALIGRIGENDPFLVGSRYEHVVGESGPLLLRINDADLNDNSGALEVLVEVER